jgi:hypothetical protein
MKRSQRFHRPHVHTVVSLESLEERRLLSTGLLPASLPFGLPALVGSPPALGVNSGAPQAGTGDTLNGAPIGSVGVGTTVHPASGTNPLSAVSVGATAAGQSASSQTADSNTLQLAAGLTLNSTVTGPVDATTTVGVAPGSNDPVAVSASATAAGQSASFHVGVSSGSTGPVVSPVAVTVTRSPGTTVNVSGQLFGTKLAVSGGISGGLTRVPGIGNPPVLPPVQLPPPAGPPVPRGGVPVLPVGIQPGAPPVAIPGGAGSHGSEPATAIVPSTSVSTVQANAGQVQSPFSLLQPDGAGLDEEARSAASALTAAADSVVAITPPEVAANTTQVPNVPAEAGPEHGDVLTQAPVDLLGVKGAMQQLIQQLRGLGQGFADLLARLGVSPWVFVALGVAAAAAEVARRNLRRFHARAAENAVLTSRTADQA